MGTLFNVDGSQAQPPGGTIKAGSAMITPEGGFAVYLKNDMVTPIVKGYCVRPSTVSDDGVVYAASGEINPIGFVYDATIAAGAYGWIVVAGRCQVYVNAAGTRGQWISMEGSGVPGQVLPAPAPGSVAIHFEECGHLIQTVSSGLAFAIIHFN